MRTKWVKGKHGLPELRYALKHDVTVRKKGLFGITHLKTEKRVDWADWKTYKKVKYRPFTIEEMMFYDDLFGD